MTSYNNIITDEEIFTAPPRPPQLRRRRWWLFILGGLFIILGTVLGFFRYQYRGAVIREMLTQTLSEYTGLTCQIAEVEVSWWRGAVTVRDLRLLTAAASPSLFTLKYAEFDIAIWRSLFSAKLYTNFTIDGWLLTINRERRRVSGNRNQSGQQNAAPVTLPTLGENTDDENHTTNIHDTLRTFSQLPWLEWAQATANLGLVDFAIEISNGKIELYDLAGRLGECHLDAKNIAVRKNGDYLTMDIAATLTTANAPQIGELTLHGGVQLDRAAENPLAAWQNLDCAVAFKNLDLPYLARYYNLSWRWGQRNRLLLGAPLSGEVTLRAASLADNLSLHLQTTTPEIFHWFTAGEKQAVTFPALNVSGGGQLQLTGEWKIESLNLAVGDNTAKILELHGDGNGKLGENLMLNLKLSQNLGAFAASPLAVPLDLSEKFVGDVSWRVLAKIGRGERSHVSVDLIAENLEVKVDDKMQNFPLNGRVACKFMEDGKGNAENLEIDLKLASPIINFSTLGGTLKMPQWEAWRQLRGQFALEINTQEIYRRFQEVLAKLDIHQINEQINGTLTCDENSLQAALTLAQISENPDPLSLTATVSTQGDAAFKAVLKSLDDAVFVEIGGKVTPDQDQPQLPSIEFTQQGAMRMEKGAALYARFAPLFAGKKLPRLVGGLRNSLVGKFTPTPLTLAAKFKVILEKAELQDADFKWSEAEANLRGEFAYHGAKKLDGENETPATLTIPQLKLLSSSVNADLMIGALPITALAQSPAEIIAALPAMQIGMAVSENGLLWRQINYWKNNFIPSELFSLNTQMMLQAAFVPQQRTLYLQKVELKAPATPDTPAALRELNLTTTLTNLEKIAATPTLPLILQNLPNGLTITRATVAVNELKQYPAFNAVEALKNLHSRDLIISNLQLTPQTSNSFTMSGALTTAAIYVNAANQPQITLSGTLNFAAEQPLKLQLDNNTLAASGVLDLTNCALNAQLGAYNYKKTGREPLHLTFNATQDANTNGGEIRVARAALIGGALPVEVQNLTFAMPNEQLKFGVELLKLTTPFNLTARDLVVDQPQNTVRGNLAFGETNLATLKPFLGLAETVQLAGTVSGATVNLATKYQTLQTLGDPEAPNLPLNDLQIKIGAINAQLTNTQNAARLHATLGGVDFDGKKILLNDLLIANPPKFSSAAALSLKRLQIAPQWATAKRQPLIINEIIIDQAKVLYESVKNWGNNLSALEKIISDLSPTPTVSSSPTISLPRENTPKPPVPVVIKILRTENSRVKIISPLIGSTELPLNLTLTDVGESGTSGIVTQVFKSMLGAILKETVTVMLKSPELVGKVKELVADNLIPENLKSLIPANLLSGAGDLAKNLPADLTQNLPKGLLDSVLGGDQTPAADKTLPENKTGVVGAVGGAAGGAVKGLLNTFGIGGKKTEETPSSSGNENKTTPPNDSPKTNADNQSPETLDAGKLGKQLFNMFK